MKDTILCVDDDAMILKAYRAFLTPAYNVEAVHGGAEALAFLAASGPVAVVASDLHMPQMNGIQLLAETRRRYPDMVRVLVTGHADLSNAIKAVNDGHVFRFLTKPCPPASFLAAIDAAAAQYRLITAERVLLDQTLRGCVRVLGEVLALVKPPAFGRANRAQQLVRSLGTVLEGALSWEVELAATLSQLGCVIIPDGLLTAVERGEQLTPEQQKMLSDHPAVAQRLLQSISRLEPVAESIAYQDKRYDGANLPALVKSGNDIPFAARLLKVVLDFDALTGRHGSKLRVVEEMKQRKGWYDPEILKALEALVLREASPVPLQVKALQLKEGMILVEDLLDDKGVLLLRKGHTLTEPMILRIQNYESIGRIAASLVVSCP